MPRRTTLRVLVALSVALAMPAGAADEISTDITVDLAGTLATDEDVVEDVAGTATKIDLGTLPAAADVNGYSVANNGDVLFSLDIGASLLGGVDVTSRDVVRWNGSLYALEFVGADHGIPAGAKIDAIGVVAGDLLLSFDVTATVGNITADDEDLVRLESTQPDVWSLYFDGSAEGVPAGADLDGADLIDATGDLALSFDISGTVGGVNFDDEDILAFDPSGSTWSMKYDGSAHFASLAAADVDAVFAPEPASIALGVTAFAVLLAARRRRRPRSRSAVGEEQIVCRIGSVGCVVAVATIWFAVAGPASAADGVGEINQACVATGCFPGDAPGFPVQLASGSYRLTGDLTPPDQNTAVIRVSSGVSIDLNGFSIQSTNTFSGPGGACSASGTGSGIEALPTDPVDNVSIANGHIRGMGAHGIVLSGSGFRIERVVAEQNCGNGISVGNFALVVDSVARRNASAGISTSAGSHVGNSVADSNGGNGIFGLGRAVIEGCVANANGGSGMDLDSLTSTGSLVLDSTASANAVNGISLTDNSMALRCSTNGNGQRGIDMTGNSGVGSVTANGNGVSNVFGSPRLVNCIVVGGAQSCP